MIAVKLWKAPIDISVKIWTAFCIRKVSDYTFMMPPTDDNNAMMVNIVKSSLYVASTAPCPSNILIYVIIYTVGVARRRVQAIDNQS